MPIVIDLLDDTDDEIQVTAPAPKRLKLETGSDSTSGLLTPTSVETKQSQTTTSGHSQLRSRRTTVASRFQSAPSSPPAADSLDEADTSESSEGSSKTLRRKTYRTAAYLEISGPEYPRSAYAGREPVLRPTAEGEADSNLRVLAENAEPDADWVFYRLEGFSIYRPPHGHRTHNHELTTLDRLRQDRYPEFYFDGVLSYGDQEYYVEAVPFEIVTVDGYGDDPDDGDVSNQICIQSKLQSKVARGKGAWYQLGSPAPEYKRFYHPFLWLARFTKYFVAYLLEKDHVTLSHFRSKFIEWLETRQSAHNQNFQKWLKHSQLRDFRTTVAANVGYLWKECHGLDLELRRHFIWQEIDPQHLRAIPEQPNLEKLTVVTPFAFECFRGMYFGDRLVERKIDEAMLELTRRRKSLLRLTPALSKRVPRNVATPTSPRRSSPGDRVISVQPGDVVSVRPDQKGAWRTENATWYAYVQDVCASADGTRLDVLWLYEPTDTTLGKAYYPFQNELFLSDNCSCGNSALDLECVIEKIPVVFFAQDPHVEEGFFVRRKFRTVHEQDTYDFVDLRKSDFHCHCDHPIPIFQECCEKYSVNDTVLVREWSAALHEDRLEPARIVSFDQSKQRIHVQLFGRKHGQIEDTTARPNELVLGDLRDKPADKIIRKCHIRYFTAEQIATKELPPPYNRDGTGDFFYLARSERPQDQSQAFVEGWDPNERRKSKLRGMGIFCGGGTFDRGLEEGGAVEFRYAVDWAQKALHSYRANAHPGVHYFLGSVNDYLAKAMAGHDKPGVARPGEFNVLSAGSPCPGFSSLQVYKLSDESKQNASMVASVISFVDFFVPEYLILENVVTMTNGMGPNKDENVFAQIVAALVAMGYQVQQFLMDAWSYGSSQQRSRVFIIASAPGLVPFKPPPHSHAHPRSTNVMKRALGTSSNGKCFGSRRDEFTAFEHCSPRQAVQDLPFIGDAQPQICTRFPDHRHAAHESGATRTRLAMVPTRPRGMGLIQAKSAGLLRGEPLEHCENVNNVRKMKTSTIYARVDPEFLFPTIVTRLAVNDGINGRVVHWSQQRTLTIMEARRAQGYLDHEVIIGSPVEQLKIIGNSVDRKVALVLGLALRESWEGSHLDVDQDLAEGLDVEQAPDTFTTSLTAEDEEAASTHEDPSLTDTATASPILDKATIMGRALQSLSEKKANGDRNYDGGGYDNDDSEKSNVQHSETPNANVAAKIMINLSLEEREEIRNSKRGFQVIKRLLEERKDLARRS